MNLFSLWKLALAGKLRLWRVFWIGHVLTYFILTALFGLFSAVLESPLFNALYIPTLLLYMGFNFAAMWKCAMNVDKKIWGHLARVYSGLALVTYVIGVIAVPIALLTK